MGKSSSTGPGRPLRAISNASATASGTSSGSMTTVAYFVTGVRDADDVGLLERVLAEERARHVAGDGDERDAVHHGRGQADDEVDRPRAAGGHRHPDAPRGAAEAVGRMRSTLLVANEDVAQRELAQDVVDRQDRPSRVAEDRGCALADQRLAYRACADTGRHAARGVRGRGRTGGRLVVGEPEGCHAGSIPSERGKQQSRLALRLAGFGLRFRVLACRLVLGASSIPPSKEDDEPKNHDYEEQAEQPGRRRVQGRTSGGHAALL